MNLRRLSLVAGIAFLTAFVYVVVAHAHDGGNALVVVLALIALVAAGNLLYGRHSHGAAAQARTGPAQEAHNRAIDDARRREAEAKAQAQAPTQAQATQAPAPTQAPARAEDDAPRP